MSVINITNLSKKYRNLVVFNDLTITFVPGDMIFWLATTVVENRPLLSVY